jgi:hypothetical protein
MSIQIEKNYNKNFKKINFNCIAVFSRDFSAKKNLREVKRITFRKKNNVRRG